ncbi:hypothetical protein ACLMJK_002434 [Lecanora helva]
MASTPIHDLKQDDPPLLSKRDSNPSNLYPPYTLSVPVDHFHNESKYEPHSSDSFDLRYWFDATYYKSGGPVFVLESGEDTGIDRLPYLQKGILHQLAQATNGIGVVLEHRYYGTSFPTPDLSTKNLRFLTTEQALADTAYFAQNVVFKGLENHKLTASDTPWIAYGGSYAGAFVAFLRTQYPDVFFGAISSSGVTEAIYDFWNYYSPVAQYAPSECISTTQKLTNVVDNILINKASNTTLVTELKSAFGLEELTYNNDFANVLSAGVGGWQGKNWDPDVNDPSFGEYCGNISSDQTLYDVPSGLLYEVEDLIYSSGYGNQPYLVNRMLNYIGWINTTHVTPCFEGGESADQCFSTHNQTFYSQDDIRQTWRSWPYQYCTQWGFFQTGSGVPQGKLPLISRTIDLDFQQIICQDAFGIKTPPSVNIINAYGGYNIKYSRLAFIDGQADPWRGATPHADGAPARSSSTDQPFELITGAVHHWDENGLFDNETENGLPPQAVLQTQLDEAAFVSAWLQEWH